MERVWPLRSGAPWRAGLDTHAEPIGCGSRRPGFPWGPESGSSRLSRLRSRIAVFVDAGGAPIPRRRGALGDLLCTMPGHIRGHCPTGCCRGTLHSMQSVPGCRYRVRRAGVCACPGACRISALHSFSNSDGDSTRTPSLAPSQEAGGLLWPIDGDAAPRECRHRTYMLCGSQARHLQMQVQILRVVLSGQWRWRLPLVLASQFAGRCFAREDVAQSCVPKSQPAWGVERYRLPLWTNGGPFIRLLWASLANE